MLNMLYGLMCEEERAAAQTRELLCVSWVLLLCVQVYIVYI